MPTNDDQDDERSPTTAATQGDKTELGPAADETEILPPSPTEAAPELAWSVDDDDEDEGPPHSWGWVWGHAAVLISCLAVAAIVIAAVGYALSQRGAPSQPSRDWSRTPMPGIAASTPTSKPPADDDEYVAMTISPHALSSGTPGWGGFGTAGSQDMANQIAISECRAHPGNDDCTLVSGGMYHGCVAVAFSGTAWAGGSGIDADAAKADAIGRLSIPAATTWARCSDPPGILKSPPSTAAPPAARAQPLPPAPTTVTVQAAPPAPAPESVDDQFIAALRVAHINIDNRAQAINVARQVCTQFNEGNSRPDITSNLQGRAAGRVTPTGIADFINDAVAFYCPQYGGN